MQSYSAVFKAAAEELAARMEDREADGMWETRLAMTELAGTLTDGAEKVADEDVKEAEGAIVKELADARLAKRMGMEATLNCMMMIVVICSWVERKP
jgi:hypothetical protein